MDLGLEGRRCLVLAASAGLGQATACALAAEGARIAICGRNRQRIEQAAAAMRGDVAALVGDVADAGRAVEVVDAAAAALGGPIEVLVLNGPGPPSGDFASTPVDRYPEALATMLLPAVAMCQRVVPSMQVTGWGRIVAITSIAVRQPIGRLILSNTARTGLTGFLKTLALEVARDGVTVNSVQPGLHETQRVQDVYATDLKRELEHVPARRLGGVQAFGRIVAFLCSEHASYITGAAIPVDGGVYGGLQ